MIMIMITLFLPFAYLGQVIDQVSPAKQRWKQSQRATMKRYCPIPFPSSSHFSPILLITSHSVFYIQSMTYSTPALQNFSFLFYDIIYLSIYFERSFFIYKTPLASRIMTYERIITCWQLSCSIRTKMLLRPQNHQI